MKENNRNMAKVSIIIPVYNTGKYLYRCIDSVLNQTYRDIELIIVDDGSCEETACICDEIADRDNRIYLIHKQNEGVSAARNTGLDLVMGEYVGFVDSDDWIDDDMFENLVREMETYDADVVMCDATTVWDNGKTEMDTFACLQSNCVLSKSEITPERQLELAGSSWRALYRSRQLREEEIRFPVGLKFSEDRIFNMKVLGLSNRFRYIKHSFYNRYMREDSCVNTYHKDFVNVTLSVNEIMKDILSYYWDESYLAVFERRNLRSIGHHAISIFLVDKMSFDAKWSEVKRLCENQKLREILNKQSYLEYPLRQILNKRVYVLFALAMIERLKNIIKSFVK